VSAAADEYRHVTVTGTFLDVSQTLVQAVTELGAGYWVLTPLRAMDGSIVLVNRGFVPAEDRDRVAAAGAQLPGATGAPAGGGAGNDGASARTVTLAPKTVIGLLRISEPRGGFLRHNNAATNHWYSRDVQAIAAARGLTRVAPYFIDAEAARPSATSGVNSAPGVASAPSPPSAGGAAPAAGAPVVPVAGLTVIAFHNSHLVYAITWYTLALMVAAAIWLGIRSETRT
jgi:surfeit locus 1 family protein